jgi:S1-C subfamily serine protease
MFIGHSSALRLRESEGRINQILGIWRFAKSRARPRDGDIIIALEGKPVAGWTICTRVLAEVRVGVSSTLTVLRLSEKLELKIVPQEAS